MDASIENPASAQRRTPPISNIADAGERSLDSRGNSTALAVSERPNGTDKLDKSLACFSIGLGLVEVLAPRWFGRVIGTGDRPTVLRLCGLREITSGIGLLSRRTAADAAASRLAGDAIDLALLSVAFTVSDAQRGRLALATTAAMGAAVADAYAVSRHTRSDFTRQEPVHASIIINSTPEKLYAFWRNVENLPRFMAHLESVERIDGHTSRWTVKGPAGSRVHWQAELVEDRVNELLAWQTRPDSEIQHRGRVTFKPAPGNRGCIVQVEMTYAAPAGRVGVGVAKVLGEEPEQQIKRDLRSLKQCMETGEVATTRGQSAGRRSMIGKMLTRREP